MRLDLADLQLFLCIVDAGSITQGAARAHLALASASERLRNMEADAGVALLQRHSRGVVTTDAGEALAHHARLIVHQQHVLKSELRDFSTGMRGTLQLYANTAALTDFLPPRLAPWLAERPHLRVVLKERASTEIVAAIRADIAEAGIVSDAVAAHELQQQPVAKDHLVLIVPPGHRLAQTRTLRFADVLNESFVGLAPGNALQDHIDERAQAMGKTLPLRIRMKTFEGLCQMVAHGVGLGIVPQTIAQRYRRKHGYHAAALTDDWARRRLCICFRHWHELSPPMQSLMTHLGAIPPESQVAAP